MRRTSTLLVGASFLTLSIGMSIYALYQNQEATSEVSVLGSIRWLTKAIR